MKDIDINKIFDEMLLEVNRSKNLLHLRSILETKREKD